MMRKADVSFEELYNCYKVRFERFAISYIQDRSVAEDIVTDSFVYWWEHRDRVGSKDENPAAYILATIRHKCLNHLRALQVRLRSHNEIRESQSRIVQENIRSLELCDPVHLFAGEVEALVRQINALRVSLIGILLSSMPFLNDELKLNLPVHWINCVED